MKQSLSKGKNGLRSPKAILSRTPKENCIVTVNLGIWKGDYKTFIDTELFLPQSWSMDRECCEKVGIDKDTMY